MVFTGYFIDAIFEFNFSLFTPDYLCARKKKSIDIKVNKNTINKLDDTAVYAICMACGGVAEGMYVL